MNNNESLNHTGLHLQCTHILFSTYSGFIVHIIVAVNEIIIKQVMCSRLGWYMYIKDRDPVPPLTRSDNFPHLG